MKHSVPTRRPLRPAFTLVEMLVVIAIIGILAALIFPAFKGANITAMRKKAHNELQQIQAAIDSYYAKYNHYPPDNPGKPALNQLYYELLGTVQKGAAFETLDGREQLPLASVSTVFGPGISGFVNCTRSGGDDATSSAAKNCLPALRPSYYGFATNGARFAVLTSSMPWPKDKGPVLNGVGFPNELNPIRYNSSSPTHNPKTYDLWVDIVVAGKTNRISNWNSTYETVSY